MAYPNKVIHNPVTGQSIRFIHTSSDTDGQLLEMESTFQPESTRPVAHYHPIQHEDFTVKTGQLTVDIEGSTRILGPGDTLHIAPGTVHAMWNASATETLVQWQVRPALQTEYFFETAFGLANEKGAANKPTPPVLQSAFLLQQYWSEFRLGRPGKLAQKIILCVLTPVTQVLRYQNAYKKYLN